MTADASYFPPGFVQHSIQTSGATINVITGGVCPTLHMYNTTNRTFATFYFHWFFLIQREPLPETLIGSDPEAWLRQFMGAVPGIDPRAFAEYLRCFSDPAAIHATCEEYRAAATIDLTHDEADLDRKIACPLLVLWGERGLVGQMYDALAVWRERASNVAGRALACGHWIPEEAPDEAFAELRAFLGG